jgi:hypothetical protein
VTLALVQRYHALGLRERILPLPVMTAIVLAMIWRQLPGVQTVVEILAREGRLWAEPVRVRAEALKVRLRVLPACLFAELFHTLVPTFLARSAARQRPAPPAVARLRRHYPAIRVLDGTGLEPVFRTVGLLAATTQTVLGGTVLAVLDLPSKLPVQLLWDEAATGNDLRLVRSGDGGNGQQVVRLLAVQTPAGWRRYLTNVLDPAVLSVADAVTLYGMRWRLEDTFLLGKRLLGLSYLWTGAANGIQRQCWATWLLYAVLIDLCAAIAETLDEALDWVSVEMVSRSLDFFCGASQRGEATDLVAYLAHPAQASLGMLKKRRPKRERERLARLPPTLI